MRLQRRKAQLRQNRIGSVTVLFELGQSGERLVRLVLPGKVERREEGVARLRRGGLLPIIVSDLADGAEHDQNGNPDDDTAEARPDGLHLVRTEFVIDLADKAVVLVYHVPSRPPGPDVKKLARSTRFYALCKGEIDI